METFIIWRSTRLQELKWASLRLIFYAYIGMAIFSVVGGFLTAPVMTYYFLGDWRFWKHWKIAWRLFPHAWKMIFLLLKGNNEGFMFSVNLFSPPHSTPDRNRVYLQGSWEHGSSCGTCIRCCELIHCPVLDEQTGLCTGYDSFFWRYFNCGRFPSRQAEIDFYGCPKWGIFPQPVPADLGLAGQGYPISTGDEGLTAEES